MIEAELPDPGVAYRSRPAVLHAAATPLAWLGRARIAAVLLVGGALLPWSVVLMTVEHLGAIAFASILCSCAGTWLLTARSGAFPFDERASSRIRRLARALAAAELVLSLLWLPTLAGSVQILSPFVWVPMVVAVHIGVVITRLLALRSAHERIGARHSARNSMALLNGYLFFGSCFVVAAPAALVDGTFALVCGLIGLAGLLIVYCLGLLALLLGAHGLRIVLEQRWVRVSSTDGQNWAVLALLRGGHALVLLPLEPPRAFDSGVQAQDWLFQQRYADPARVHALW